MTRIGIVVTDPASYPPQDTDCDTPALVDYLCSRGVSAEPVVWHDRSVDWESFTLLVIRSPWDYVDRATEFSDWLDFLGRRGVRVVNDPALIRWNMDKHYLAELARPTSHDAVTLSPVSIVPTSWCTSEAEISAALRGIETAQGESAEGETARVVVKPVIGAGSARTGLFEVTDPAAVDLGRQILRNGGEVMVQAELPELTAGREKALYLVDGHLTHAISRGAFLALGGGYIGGVYEEHPRLVEVDEDERSFARDVVRAVTSLTGQTPLYARIDTVRSTRFGLVLLEAELFEPDFHLDVAPHVTAEFGEAILGRISGVPTEV